MPHRFNSVLPAAPPAGVPSGRWRWTGWLFGLLVLSTMIVVVADRSRIERFLALLASASLPWLLVGLSAQAATYGCLGFAWRQGLRGVGIRWPFRELAALAMAKLFVDQSMPTAGLSGTAFFTASLLKHGVSPPSCLALLLANVFSHQAADLLVALYALAMLWAREGTPRWMTTVLWLFALLSVGIPGGVLALRRHVDAELPWLRRIPQAATLLRQLCEAPTMLLRRPSVLVTMILMNAAVVVLDAATLWMMLHAVGRPASFSVALAGYLLAMMVAELGPVPLGLGTFEATCVSVLALHGVPVEGALAATLLQRGCTTWLPMVPGLFLAKRELRGPTGPPAQEA